ncbi:MAG: hypothetical protein LBU46_00140 [Candidatus Accumulibacter sp.]|jgi:hypothetical protein|nr:hypothetical protein [Accumulibacter sp.]
MIDEETRKRLEAIFSPEQVAAAIAAEQQDHVAPLRPGYATVEGQAEDTKPPDQ